MVMTDADADAATATATATADADAATATATATATAAEKPKHAEKPDYAPYNGASTADGGTGARVRRGGGVVDSVVARWRREDMLDKSPLALHAAAAVFAFVALVLVASNQHGDWMQFNRYLLSIASLALLYSLAQAARHAHRMRGGVDPVSSASGRLLDFVGDQASHCFQLLVCSYKCCADTGGFCIKVHAYPSLDSLIRTQEVVAYLLMSALSAAAPITNRMRSAVVNNFTDATAAAISMTFFAFAALALSAVVSGYKLSKQTYM
ncbi:CASP-like protein 4B1 [Zea mays]|uniref:CASP-like protein n=1 Tax=Zea mays TaxID=4577 RepID=A0A3L6DFV8_MAIZE|nr:CASP-like protein 4B1 [Zea mays]